MLTIYYSDNTSETNNVSSDHVIDLLQCYYFFEDNITGFSFETI